MPPNLPSPRKIASHDGARAKYDTAGEEGDSHIDTTYKMKSFEAYKHHAA